MTDEELARVLCNDRATAELAHSLRADAAFVPAQAVDLSVGSDEAAATDARQLIYWLQELAVRPLAEADPPLPGQRVALAASAVDAELASRRKVVAHIDALLSDTRPLQEKAGHAVAPRPAPMRVCDMAYLFMRRLGLKLDEPAVDDAEFADAFAKMPVGERAARIRTGRESKRWKRAVTGQEV